jgi:outer membrane protein TolC
MKRYRFIIGLILLLSSSWLCAQDDLNNYLELAARNNPGLKAKFSEYMAALEQAPQQKALPNPQIAFAYFIKPVETRVGPQQFKFSASQLFPWFGTLKAKENVAIQSAKVKYEKFRDTKSALFNEVRSNYLNLYFNKKAINISRENIEILNSFQKLAYIKVETGSVSAVDAYSIEMEIGDLENQLSQLKDQQLLLEVNFAKLLNLDKLGPIRFPETLWSDDFPLLKENIFDSILNNNHQLLGLSLQQQALAYQKDVAKNAGKPGFSLGFDYTVVASENKKFTGSDALLFPKVGISIPLYRNKYKAMVNEVFHLQQAKDFEKENTKNLLQIIFEKSWTEYLDANRRIDLFVTQKKLAYRSIKLLETEYTTGNRNFEDILRMERRVLKYSLELEKARTDKQAAVSFINYLMGK